MIDHRDCHLPSPLIMFTCTGLRHALLAWQMNKGVHPKDSKSNLKADRSDCLNYFIYMIDSGKNGTCCAETGCKLLILPGVADMYTFLMISWNTLPESYQQWVYQNNLVNGKCQMQKAENPMPAEVISTKAAHADNAFLLDDLTSKVALEEPEIGSTDPNTRIDNNCTDDELHSGMPGSCEDPDDEGDKIDESDAIPISSR